MTQFKVRKIAFHEKYTQAPAYVWSAKKIVKIISIKKGEEYVGFLNLNFFVLRGANEEEKSRFTIADFPIMNPSDFISLLDILKFSVGNECEDMGVFALAKAHISSFFRNYLLRIARFDITVAYLFGQSLAPPPTTIENFEHLKAGQIVDKPWGVVFKGLSSDSEKTPKSEDSEVLCMEDPKTSQPVLSFVCTRIVQYVVHESSILLASTLIGYSL
ncbi:hypothetical protein L1887_39061 [Cichorium endivia]|nr:hypothetical protein L1887_39061 [Cichorium endivia]